MPEFKATYSISPAAKMRTAPFVLASIQAQGINLEEKRDEPQPRRYQIEKRYRLVTRNERIIFRCQSGLSSQDRAPFPLPRTRRLPFPTPHHVLFPGPFCWKAASRVLPLPMMERYQDPNWLDGLNKIPCWSWSSLVSELRWVVLGGGSPVQSAGFLGAVEREKSGVLWDVSGCALGG